MGHFTGVDIDTESVGSTDASPDRQAVRSAREEWEEMSTNIDDMMERRGTVQLLQDIATSMESTSSAALPSTSGVEASSFASARELKLQFASNNELQNRCMEARGKLKVVCRALLGRLRSRFASSKTVAHLATRFDKLTSELDAITEEAMDLSTQSRRSSVAESSAAAASESSGDHRLQGSTKAGVDDDGTGTGTSSTSCSPRTPLEDAKLCSLREKCFKQEMEIQELRLQVAAERKRHKPAAVLDTNLRMEVDKYKRMYHRKSKELSAHLRHGTPANVDHIIILPDKATQRRHTILNDICHKLRSEESALHDVVSEDSTSVDCRSPHPPDGDAADDDFCRNRTNVVSPPVSSHSLAKRSVGIQVGHAPLNHTASQTDELPATSDPDYLAAALSVMYSRKTANGSGNVSGHVSDDDDDGDVHGDAVPTTGLEVDTGTAAVVVDGDRLRDVYSTEATGQLQGAQSTSQHSTPPRGARDDAKDLDNLHGTTAALKEGKRLTTAECDRAVAAAAHMSTMLRADSRAAVHELLQEDERLRREIEAIEAQEKREEGNLLKAVRDSAAQTMAADAGPWSAADTTKRPTTPTAAMKTAGPRRHAFHASGPLEHGAVSATRSPAHMPKSLKGILERYADQLRHWTIRKEELLAERRKNLELLLSSYFCVTHVRGGYRLTSSLFERARAHSPPSSSAPAKAAKHHKRKSTARMGVDESPLIVNISYGSGAEHKSNKSGKQPSSSRNTYGMFSVETPATPARPAGAGSFSFQRDVHGHRTPQPYYGSVEHLTFGDTALQSPRPRTSHIRRDGTLLLPALAGAARPQTTASPSRLGAGCSPRSTGRKQKPAKHHAPTALGRRRAHTEPKLKSAPEY